MNRPERVLKKNDGQAVTCSCGHTFNVPYNAKEASCPRCGNTVNWGLSK